LQAERDALGRRVFPAEPLCVRRNRG
jgi:hypothetical protein